jgi:hypothetical protein
MLDAFEVSQAIREEFGDCRCDLPVILSLNDYWYESLVAELDRKSRRKGELVGAGKKAK